MPASRTLGAALALALLTATLPAAAEEPGFTPAQEEAIGALVRDYILEHPEIILEAVERLQAREQEQAAAAQQQAIAALQAELYEDDVSPVAGNPEGDITIVEFFDYNCPYCKRLTPELFGLLARDGQIRLIAKEWPFFGEDSEFAARAALAAARQGSYAAFHQALMGLRGPANPQTVERVAGEVGLDWERLQEDMQDAAITEHLERNKALAKRIGLRGTPAMVIGGTLLPGAAPAAEIAATVAEERRKQ